MQSDPPSNQRTSPRYAVALRVDYGEQSEYLHSWTENISEGGLFIRSERELALGEQVHLTLSFPGLLKPVEVDGMVAWARGSAPGGMGGYGVQVRSPSARREMAALALAVGRLEGTTPELNIIQALGRYSVVIADDNEHIHRACVSVVNRFGRSTSCDIEAHYAYNGHQALNLVREKRPNLLITDVFMPVMDGPTLIKNIRADPDLSDTPVIVVSAGRADARSRMGDTTVDAFLDKPVQFASLFETIASLHVHARG